MIGPRYTPLAASLPSTVPFVGPETQERARGRRFAARLGANESAFGPSPRAIAAMQAAAAAFEAVQIRPVPARYPMGSEKQLIQVLTGREVPADGRAFDIGVFVHNVGTALAVRAACAVIP